MLKIAVYPGSFDPVTNGHLDLISRALTIFDSVIVAVAENPHKKPLFNLKERISMLREATKGLENIKIDSLKGLLVDYLKMQKAYTVIRGVRVMTDFEYEFQMALMNRRLDNRVETVFLIPNETYSYISSSVIKEVASHGGDIDGLVPDVVKKTLLEKFKS